MKTRRIRMAVRTVGEERDKKRMTEKIVVQSRKDKKRGQGWGEEWKMKTSKKIRTSYEEILVIAEQRTGLGTSVEVENAYGVRDGDEEGARRGEKSGLLELD